MARETWRSRTGFILAALGSAIGLANIVKFPYIVGRNGGAAFIFVYLICLVLVSLPVLVSETLIGRTAQSSPTGSFRKLGGSRFWTFAGSGIVVTGFLVSAFYSALAGWILGYLLEAGIGNLHGFTSADEAASHFNSLLASPTWALSFHFLFMLACTGILVTGVRSGIERACQIMMPTLFISLSVIVIKGIMMGGADDALVFLFKPDWSALTPTAVLVALGQSFFTVSAGQGTMITYGSYLDKDTSLVHVCIPIVLADTLISIMAAVGIFGIVFAAGMPADAGFGLIFNTLPLVFSQITGGYILGLVFFMLVSLAAVTSEISAMEPVVAFLIDEKGWTRRSAVLACAVGAFLIGIPCALAPNLLSHCTLGDMNILDMFDFVATGILVPLGGLAGLLLIGWRWGLDRAFLGLEQGALSFFKKNRWVKWYFRVTIRYIAPIMIILVFLRALGIL